MQIPLNPPFSKGEVTSQRVNLKIVQRHKAKFLQFLYTRDKHLYTDLILFALPCNHVFPTGANEMDWLYLLLIIALFGLSDLLIRGIEKLRGSK
jgi:hypothetical protein